MFFLNNKIYSDNNNILLEIVQKLNDIINDMVGSNINKIIINKIKDIILLINNLIKDNKKNIELIRKDIRNLNDKIDKNFKELKNDNKQYYDLLIGKKCEKYDNFEDNLKKFKQIFGVDINNKNIEKLNLKENINVNPDNINNFRNNMNNNIQINTNNQPIMQFNNFNNDIQFQMNNTLIFIYNIIYFIISRDNLLISL